MAYYTGDYTTAAADFAEASLNGPFIQCMIGMTWEKLGDREKAMEAYRKAAQMTARDRPGAFARPFPRRKLGL